MANNFFLNFFFKFIIYRYIFIHYRTIHKFWNFLCLRPQFNWLHFTKFFWISFSMTSTLNNLLPPISGYLDFFCNENMIGCTENRLFALPWWNFAYQNSIVSKFQDKNQCSNDFRNIFFLFHQIIIYLYNDLSSQSLKTIQYLQYLWYMRWPC